MKMNAALLPFKGMKSTMARTHTRVSMAALAALVLTPSVLVSCQGEDKKKTDTDAPAAEVKAAEETPAPAATAAPAPAPVTETAPPAVETAKNAAEETQEELNRYLNGEVMDLIIKSANSSAVRDVATVLLEKLENHYQAISEGPFDVARLELAVDIAECQRQLTAWERAYASYERALKDWEALAMKDKTEIRIQRLKSSIYNGLAFTLLARTSNASSNTDENRQTALNYFKEQLDSDLSIFNAVGPKEGDALPAGSWSDDINRATNDLISSYRCVGDGFLLTGNNEDALAAYLEGVKIAQRVQKLSEQPTLQLIRILSSLGDLQLKMDKEKEAVQSLTSAAQVAIQLNKQSSDTRVKMETKQIVDRLAPIIQRHQPAQAEAAAVESTDSAE